MSWWRPLWAAPYVRLRFQATCSVSKYTSLHSEECPPTSQVLHVWGGHGHPPDHLVVLTFPGLRFLMTCPLGITAGWRMFCWQISGEYLWAPRVNHAKGTFSCVFLQTLPSAARTSCCVDLFFNWTEAVFLTQFCISLVTGAWYVVWFSLSRRKDPSFRDPQLTSRTAKVGPSQFRMGTAPSLETKRTRTLSTLHSEASLFAFSVSLSSWWVWAPQTQCPGPQGQHAGSLSIRMESLSPANSQNDLMILALAKCLLLQKSRITPAHEGQPPALFPLRWFLFASQNSQYVCEQPSACQPCELFLIF